MSGQLLKKRGISPVIATVLLVAMVIVIGLIVFLWFKGITQEAVTKFGGQNIELVCDEVQFSSSYSGGKLLLSNTGNVPVFNMKIKVTGQGSHSTEDLSSLSSNWPEKGLRQGGAFSSLSLDFSGASKVLVIPVLLGISDSGEQLHVCEDRYGQQVI